MSGIDGKVVAITGASSGIGEATAIHLAECGAAVVLGARGGDRLGRLAARIADAGGRVALMQADVTRRDHLRDFVALACDRFGQLDVLINNAGIMPVSPLDQLRVDDWEAVTSPTAGSRRLLLTRPAREGPVQPVGGYARRARLPVRCVRTRRNETPLV